jgi:hypothetical protein
MKKNRSNHTNQEEGESRASKRLAVLNLRRVNGVSRVCVISSFLFVTVISLIPQAGSQFPDEFESSKVPVQDVFALARVLKASNDNPGSYLTTVWYLEH